MFGVCKNIVQLLNDEILIISFFIFPSQYYQPEGIPSRQLEADMCALCGNKFLVKVGEEGVVENTYRLSCGHE